MLLYGSIRNQATLGTNPAGTRALTFTPAPTNLSNKPPFAHTIYWHHGRRCKKRALMASMCPSLRSSWVSQHPSHAVFRGVMKSATRGRKVSGDALKTPSTVRHGRENKKMPTNTASEGLLPAVPLGPMISKNIPRPYPICPLLSWSSLEFHLGVSLT